MSHLIDQISIIMTLISRFVSKICLLMSRETAMLGPPRYNPHFYSHVYEKIDFEFNTFSVVCSFSGDALS